MTSAAVFVAWLERAMFIGAWRRSQKPRWRVEARVTLVVSHISFVGRSVVNMADKTARVANRWATHEEIMAVHGKILKRRQRVLTRVNAINDRTSWVLQIAEQWGWHGGACGYDLTVSRDSWRHVGTFRRCLQRMVARELAVEGQVSGFLSWEVVEHICGVGFIRRSRDLHRSEELSHGFAWVVGFWHSTEPWWLWIAVESRSSRQTCMTFDGDVRENLLCLLEMFVWC